MDDEKKTNELPETASPDKVKTDKNRILTLILCAAILTLSVVSLCLAHTVQTQKKAAKEPKVQEQVENDYKESKDEKKKIASLQDGFTKITIGMSTDDMLKTVGVDYNSKSNPSVSDVPCTQYDWALANNRYTMSVLTNNNVVVGKTQNSLFAPETEVSQADLQSFGDDAKQTDIEGKYGKGILSSVLQVPGQPVQRVVFYGATNGGLWVVVYSDGEMQSVTGIEKDANYYTQNCTKRMKEIE